MFVVDRPRGRIEAIDALGEKSAKTGS